MTRDADTRSGAAAGGAPPALWGALRRMLRPLVVALLRQQVQYPQLSALLKSLYIDVARREFALGDKGTTASRLSLLTGIHRREAKRLAEAVEEGDASVPRNIGLGAQVLARWTAGPPFADEGGRPRPLPRVEERAEADFAALVRSVSVDMHPRSVLDEWLRMGVVEVDADDRVVLQTSAFVPARSFDEKAHYVGRNLRDHMAAGFENLEAETSPHFERAVYYADLPEAAVSELEALARRLAQETLERVNARARELKEADAESPGSGRRERFSLGSFVYRGAPEERGDE